MRRTIWLEAILGACLVLGFFKPADAKSPAVPNWTFMTGELLTKVCRTFMQVQRQGGNGTPEQLPELAACEYFVVGVFDTVEAYLKTSGSDAGPLLFCVPHGAHNDRALVEVVATFLDQNPAYRNNNGVSLVISALSRSFPCQH